MYRAAYESLFEGREPLGVSSTLYSALRMPRQTECASTRHAVLLIDSISARNNSTQRHTQ